MSTSHSSSTSAPAERPALRVAYLSLQAVVEGQDSWAAVMEIVGGWREQGIHVAEHFVRYPATGSPSPFARLRAMTRVQYQLARGLRDYDAIYLRGHAFAFPLALWAHLRGVPVVKECNGLYEDLFIAWPKARFARPLIEWMQRWQYRHCAAAVAVTRELGAWLAEEASPSLVAVSPNGANTEVFSPDRPRIEGLPVRYAAFFGQFAPWQGIAVLLEATRSESWPASVVLVLAGDGALRPEVQRAAAGNPERVVYLGKVAYDDAGRIVAHAIASFVPMMSEQRARAGLSPLKLYESMAAGVPIISTEAPGLAELVREERCGVVVPGGDPAALATALAEFVSRPEWAREMGERGHEAAILRHSWKVRSTQRLEILRSVVRFQATTERS